MSYIESIINQDKSIKLTRYEGEDLIIKNDIELSKIDKNSELIRICFLDFETTGLDVEENEVIQIAMKLVEFNKKDGFLINAVKDYDCFNDPGFNIDEKIIQLTGITNKMVEGECIDWEKVIELLSYSQLVVAHNASFDRKFLEKYMTII